MKEVQETMIWIIENENTITITPLSDATLLRIL